MRTFIAMAIIAAVPALADDYRVGSLTVEGPVIFEGPPTLRTAAGYLTVTNEGSEADSLIDVRAEAGEASIHETRQDGGVTRMAPVEIVEIGPGESVAFEPGGLHVMFMGVDGAALRVGAELAATLVFERAGEVAVTFAVEPRRAGGGHATH